jgi:hypothetical protein
VLPRTTTTGSEDAANGIDALRTGLEERLDDATRIAGPIRRDSNANAVARRREWNKDDPAIGRTTDTVPTRSEFLDYEFDPLFGARCRRRSSRLATIRASVSAGYRLTPCTRSRRGIRVWSGIGTGSPRCRNKIIDDRASHTSAPSSGGACRELFGVLLASWTSAGSHERSRAGLPTAAPGAKAHERTRGRPAAARTAVVQRGMRPDALDLALTQRAVAHEGP